MFFYDIVDVLFMGNVYKCDFMEELFGSVEMVFFYIDGCFSNIDFIGDCEFVMM